MTNTEDDDRVMVLVEEIERLRTENERLQRERDVALADVERLRQALRILPFKDGSKY